jgi:hypothetical protein
MSNPTATLRVLLLLLTPVGWFLAAGYQVARIIRDMRQRPYYEYTPEEHA